MTNQPDPHLVRRIAARIIRSEIDAIRDLGAMDVGEMCEDEIGALYAQYNADPSAAHDAASVAADALIDAVRNDILAAKITTGWDADAELQDGHQ